MVFEELAEAAPVSKLALLLRAKLDAYCASAENPGSRCPYPAGDPPTRRYRQHAS